MFRGVLKKYENLHEIFPIHLYNGNNWLKNTLKNSIGLLYTKRKMSEDYLTYSILRILIFARFWEPIRVSLLNLYSVKRSIKY